jgi:hypothetical protein
MLEHLMKHHQQRYWASLKQLVATAQQADDERLLGNPFLQLVTLLSQQQQLQPQQHVATAETNPWTVQQLSSSARSEDGDLNCCHLYFIHDYVLPSQSNEQRYQPALASLLPLRASPRLPYHTLTSLTQAPEGGWKLRKHCSAAWYLYRNAIVNALAGFLQVRIAGSDLVQRHPGELTAPVRFGAQSLMCILV